MALYNVAAGFLPPGLLHNFFAASENSRIEKLNHPTFPSTARSPGAATVLQEWSGR